MKTEILAILDRSGSMSRLVDETIGGFNSFVEKQKEIKGKCRLSTVIFDNEYEELYSRVKLKDVEELTKEKYYARGMTGLYDAIGKGVSSLKSQIEAKDKSKRPDKVIVLIITDGEENASKEYTLESVKSLIEDRQDNADWEFLFLGANIDSFAVSGAFGINSKNVSNYAATAAGTKTGYHSFSTVAASIRTNTRTADMTMASVVESDDANT